jgi:hypothetical protein
MKRKIEKKYWLPQAILLVVLYVIAGLIEPCDNAPDCRAKTAQSVDTQR